MATGDWVGFCLVQAWYWYNAEWSQVNGCFCLVQVYYCVPNDWVHYSGMTRCISVFVQVYYYAESQTTHTTYPDRLEVLQFPK